MNGSLYIFRGRINTEVMEVENVEDGTGRPVRPAGPGPLPGALWRLGFSCSATCLRKAPGAQVHGVGPGARADPERRQGHPVLPMGPCLPGGAAGWTLVIILLKMFSSAARSLLNTE